MASMRTFFAGRRRTLVAALLLGVAGSAVAWLALGGPAHDAAGIARRADTPGVPEVALDGERASARPVLTGRGAPRVAAPGEASEGDDVRPTDADAEVAEGEAAGDEEPSVYAGRRVGRPLDAEHPEVRRVMEIQERSTDDLLDIPGVVGTAVGLDDDGRLAVIVMTRSKDVAGIPERLEDTPVVVRETGTIVAHDGDAEAFAYPGTTTTASAVDTRVRFAAPVPIGVSTGHPSITAGTIGCRVKDADGATYALSNNHVYAAENSALLGDDVLQPGTYDGGAAPADAIGVLWDFQELEFGTSASNTIDAAIALTLESRPLGRSTPSDGYGTPKATTRSAALFMGVMKYGRTTHQTTGWVGALNGTVVVDYGPAGVARFVGQVVVYGGKFSRGGDSGSLIVVQKGTYARRPVGLLFAGGSSTTIANPIGLVLARFGVTVDGS